MSALEEALSLGRGDGCWTAFADPRYESINAMFGGWTTAVMLRAVVESTDGDVQPSAIISNFVERSTRRPRSEYERAALVAGDQLHTGLPS